MIDVELNPEWQVAYDGAGGVFPFQEAELFERFAWRYFSEHRPATERVYVPIMWQDFHCRHGWSGQQDELQQIVDRIGVRYRGERFWTVSQGDYGLLVNFPKCLVFNGGGVGDIAIPLLRLEGCGGVRAVTTPSQLAWFYGSVVGRHRVRELMSNALFGRPGMVVHDDHVARKEYLSGLCDCWFALCPRGAGRTSFRLFEALEVGVIPVYIYDKPWLPFSDLVDWESFCILCPEPEIPGLYDRLGAISVRQRRAMKAAGHAAYKRWFTPEATCRTIAEMLGSGI